MKCIASLLFVCVMVLFGYVFTFNDFKDFCLILYLFVTFVICNVIPFKKEKPIQWIDYLINLVTIVIYEVTFFKQWNIIHFSYLYLISFIALEMYLNSLRFKHLLTES